MINQSRSPTAKEITRYQHQQTTPNYLNSPLLPQEQLLLIKGFQSYNQDRPFSPIQMRDSQASLSKISGLSSAVAPVVTPQQQRIEKVSQNVGQQQIVRKFTSASVLKVDDSESDKKEEKDGENVIATSDQHLNQMQLSQLQLIRRRRVHKLISMRQELELKLNIMKEELEQDRKDLPRAKTAIGHRRITGDYPSMVQLTSPDQKSNLNVTMARGQSDFQPVFDFKKTLRAPSSDADGTALRIQTMKRSQLHNLKIELEAEEQRISRLHQKTLSLDLFTNDLPYIRDNIPGYIFGGEVEGSPSPEPFIADNASSVGGIAPSEGGLSKQLKDEETGKKKKRRKKNQMEEVQEEQVEPTQEELEEIQRNELLQKRFERAIENQYPDPSFKIFQPAQVVKKKQEKGLTGTQQMLVQLVAHTDKVASRIRYVQNKRKQENGEKQASRDRVKSQVGPVPNPVHKILKQPLIVSKKDSDLNSDLNLNQDGKINPPVKQSKSQIRNLRKLTQTMRENESYKRLGLQLAKYRAKPKSAARIDLSQIRIPSADFFVHDTHKSKDKSKNKPYLGDKTRLYDIQDIQRELEDLTEDEDEMVGKSPRSKEIWAIKRKIKVAFKRDEAPPPISVDFYKIGRVLGKGAYGKVNLAMQKLTRRLCAVKSISKAFSTKDKSAWLKLQNEVFLFKNLRHPCVIKMFENMQVEGYDLIFMELCKGGDLLHYVRKRRKLDEPTAKVLFKQIILGLQYIHSKDIAHRDIKLENILLDNCGKVKICDFGVSKLLRDQEELILECCGTPAYMAPEVIKRNPPEPLKNKTPVDRGLGYTIRCDIWSAGVVLYAMLYGQLPFKGLTPRDIKERVLKGRYICKRSASEAARNLIEGMLCVDVEKRITLSDILEHEWLADCQDDIKIFNEAEEQLMKRELNFYESKKDTDRPNCSLDEDELDELFHFSLGNLKTNATESVKNASTQSQILAPNNSTESEKQDTPEKDAFVPYNPADEVPVFRNGECMFFNYRVKRINNLYERHCNQQMDMGIYLDKEQTLIEEQTEQSVMLGKSLIQKNRNRAIGNRTSTQYEAPNESRAGILNLDLHIIQEQNIEQIGEMTPSNANKSKREMTFKMGKFCPVKLFRSISGYVSSPAGFSQQICDPKFEHKLDQPLYDHILLALP